MEKRLRCKDCKWFAGRAGRDFPICYAWIVKWVNPGQFACKKFVYKDKRPSRSL